MLYDDKHFHAPPQIHGKCSRPSPDRQEFFFLVSKHTYSQNRGSYKLGFSVHQLQIDLKNFKL